MSKRALFIFILISTAIIIFSIIYSFRFIDFNIQSVIGKGTNINEDIISTQITEISEGANTIIYRFSWKTSGSEEPTSSRDNSIKLNFNVPDLENPQSKIGTSLSDQFDVETKEVIITGIKVLGNQSEIRIKNKRAECDLVVENSKPIISCTVEAEIYSAELNNFYGDISGYADLTFKK